MSKLSQRRGVLLPDPEARLLDEHEGIIGRILRRAGKAHDSELARLEQIETYVFAWVEDGDYNPIREA